MTNYFEKLSETEKEDVQKVVNTWVDELMLINEKDNDATTRAQLTRAMCEGAARTMKRKKMI